MSLTKWTINGLVIQEINDSNEFYSISPYMGIGRYQSWPLMSKTDKQSTLLTKEAEERWFNYFSGESNNKYALAVVPSMDYMQRYLNVCNLYNLKIRVLQIESERGVPVWDGPFFNNTFMGYEYSTSQSFYAPLFDDLYGLLPPSLAKAKSSLNKYGLFDTEDDLNSYIENRKIAIEEGYDLETFGDFCRFKVSLVTESIV